MKTNIPLKNLLLTLGMLSALALPPLAQALDFDKEIERQESSYARIRSNMQPDSNPKSYKDRHEKPANNSHSVRVQLLKRSQRLDPRGF